MGFLYLCAIKIFPMILEIEVVISQIRQNLDREYELFKHSQSYQTYKNSEIQIKAQFVSHALKAIKYPHTHFIPLGGGIYKVLNFDHFELELNLFSTPSFRNRNAFTEWMSKSLFS